MGRRRVIWLSLALLLAWTMIVLPNRVHVDAAVTTHGNMVGPLPRAVPMLAEESSRGVGLPRPGPANEAYIRPEFGRQMRDLRPTILAAAHRHNHPKLSGMSDREFAVVIAALLYNEHFGWLEEEVKPIRSLTPFYESLQVEANNAGANLSIWPANLRPSVAAEILEHHIPVPGPTQAITRTIIVAGSQVDPAAYTTQTELYSAISREISDPHLAVEYMAANLERGLYRASFEGIPVTWRVLAAWHNQGIVSAREIAQNPTAASYVRRTSTYLPAARSLVEQVPPCQFARCNLAETVARAIDPLQMRARSSVEDTK